MTTTNPFVAKLTAFALTVIVSGTLLLGAIGPATAMAGAA